MSDRVIKEYWMSVAASASAHLPGNGEGSANITARVASTAGTTTYTAKSLLTRASVVDSAWDPGTAGVIAGDYIYTSGGYYGVVTDTPAVGVGVTVFVKEWRLPKRLQAAGGINRPTNGTAATIYPKCVIGDYEHVRLLRLIPTSAGTFNLLDQKATALPSGAIIVAAGGIGSTIELNMDIDSPFFVQTTAGTCIVFFAGYN